MKRAGFTMIELIFVIVILGILAAVAIPKLAATRSDAEIAKMATNAAAVVSDIGAHYTAQGTMGNWLDMTNVALETAVGTPATLTTAYSTNVLLTDGTNTCVTFAADVNGTLTVSVPAAPTGLICQNVKTRIVPLTKVHSFGGIGIAQ